MLPLSLAPRVYLDTGLLIKLADQKLTTDYLAILLGAFKDAGAVLIFSNAHIRDLCSATDHDSVDRVFFVIDQFPLIATAPPPTREELELTAPHIRKTTPFLKWSDLKLERVGDFLEFITRSSDTLAKGRLANTLTPLMSEAVAAAKKQEDCLPSEMKRQLRHVGAAHFKETIRSGDGKNLLPSLAEGFRQRGLAEEKINETMALFQPLIDLLNSQERLELLVRERARGLGVDDSTVDASLREVRTRLGSRSVMDMALAEMQKVIGMYGGNLDDFMRSFSRASAGPAAHPLWAAVPGGDALWHDLAPSLAPGEYLRSALVYSRMKDRAA